MDTLTRTDSRGDIQMDTASSPRWRKSSYSGANGGECVEVGQDEDLIAIRDTKDRTGPVLRVAPHTWRRFAQQVRRSLSAQSAAQRWNGLSSRTCHQERRRVTQSGMHVRVMSAMRRMVLGSQRS